MTLSDCPDDAGGPVQAGTRQDPCEPAAAPPAASRKLLQRKAYDIENDLRGQPQLRKFGLKVGMVGAARFDARVPELVADLPVIATIVIPLLLACQSARNGDPRLECAPEGGH